ncbi:hypothetical protein [Aureimonas frigidaquae]|nr:hypothetical protein [Aureimonas frigidaquae]
MLDGRGIVTGIDRHAVVDAALFICAALGREPASRMGVLAAGKATAPAA